RPVDLPRRRQVAFGVDLEGALLVFVRVVSEPRPVRRVKARRVGRDRRRQLDRAVAGKDAAAQEAVTAAVGSELKIAIQIAVGDALVKHPRYLYGVANLDDALNFFALAQAQLHRRKDAE